MTDIKQPYPHPLPSPRQRPLLHSPWVIFAVAFALRVTVILVAHTYRIRTIGDHFDFGFEAGRIARSLVTGHGYGNPFNGISGPTAMEPPLYPLLLAAAFKLFGVYTHAAAIAVMVADSAFSALVVPAIYEIAQRCFDVRGIARRQSTAAAPVALWSAWIWAAYPPALQYAVHWIWEMSLTVCLFSWALVVTLRLRGVGETKPVGTGESRVGTAAPNAPLLWFVLGVLWGLVALSNSSLLLCLPASMVWVVWPQLRAGGLRRWAIWRRTLAGAALTTVAFSAVLAPWVARNEHVLHAFIPARSNFGMELYNSTLPSYDAFPWGAVLPLWPGDPVFQQYVRMGEINFAHMRQRQAIANIRSEPRLIARWTVDRFFFFWEGMPHAANGRPLQEYLREFSFSLISACGLLGLALMLHQRVEGAGLFAAVFVLVPLVYYFVTIQSRFRHPIEPLIAILGVYLFRSTQKSGTKT